MRSRAIVFLFTLFLGGAAAQAHPATSETQPVVVSATPANIWQ